MTVIEIRPYRNGWKVFEAPGVEPVFLNQEQAIDYAAIRPNLVCRTRRSPLRGRVREVPLSLAPGDHPRV
jgi:hypothetical protein